MSPAEFEQALRAKGAYYHIHHPYHVAMYEGRASREQIQGWVANRFYYQVNIPMKDAAILANCPDREVRREWIQRLLDHDGAPGEDGGIEAWLRLGQAVVALAPGPKFAHPGSWGFPGGAFCRGTPKVKFRPAGQAGRRPPSSSLTELFAPQIHQSRLDSWPQHYPWIDPAGYEYFRTRLGQARRDVEHGLAITLQHYTTREGQERMLEILQFKLDILWSMLDAMSMAYELNRPPYHSVTAERVWHKGIAL
uniref:Pyrroloquinoline-quinone synthase n=1 Tax=Pseudomonas putida TaxID=303 RepID=A0A088MSD6_PSEPU|nr:PqqC [Pseudomonas putida]